MEGRTVLLGWILGGQTSKQQGSSSRGVLPTTPGASSQHLAPRKLSSEGMQALGTVSWSVTWHRAPCWGQPKPGHCGPPEWPL